MRACEVFTDETGACERPAFTPVTPQVSTPPRPLVLKEDPNTWSSFVFRVDVTSSRQRLHIAAEKHHPRCDAVR